MLSCVSAPPGAPLDITSTTKSARTAASSIRCSCSHSRSRATRSPQERVRLKPDTAKARCPADLVAVLRSVDYSLDLLLDIQLNDRSTTRQGHRHPERTGNQAAASARRGNQRARAVDSA